MYRPTDPGTDPDPNQPGNHAANSCFANPVRPAQNSLVAFFCALLGLGAIHRRQSIFDLCCVLWRPRSYLRTCADTPRLYVMTLATSFAAEKTKAPIQAIQAHKNEKKQTSIGHLL